MTSVAYIANAFPSPVEGYVMDEIRELRRRGVRVICCSARRTSRRNLSAAERQFYDETQCIRPVPPLKLAKALSRLASCGPILQPMLQAGFRESVNMKQRLRTMAHTALGVALADELAPLRVDHIHAHHGYYSSWMAMIAARLVGIGFSFTLHGSDLLLDDNLLGTKLRFCRSCFTVSNYNRDYILRNYSQLSAAKLFVQRLGVQLPAKSPVHPVRTEHVTPLLLTVGRLTPVKNHQFLIEACAALRNEGRRFQCWIAGAGPEYSNLARQIRRLGLQQHVCLLGHVAQPRLSAIYSRADVVVLTSRSEGLPVVLMEAMAHARLVLAPAITGIPELVEHGKNGFLYQQDSIRDFVESVGWILDCRSYLDAIRSAAVQTIATKYDREQNIRCFADQFLARIAAPRNEHENPILQQVQLSV